MVVEHEEAREAGSADRGCCFRRSRLPAPSPRVPVCPERPDFSLLGCPPPTHRPALLLLSFKSTCSKSQGFRESRLTNSSLSPRLHSPSPCAWSQSSSGLCSGALATCCPPPRGEPDLCPVTCHCPLSHPLAPGSRHMCACRRSRVERRPFPAVGTSVGRF